MPISIHIPEHGSRLLETCRRRGCEAGFHEISASQSRPIVFYEEVVAGFVIHTSTDNTTVTPPDLVCLSVSTSGDKFLLANGGSDGAPNVSADENGHGADVYKTSLHTSMTCETEVEGHRTKVTIWTFEVPVGAPKHDMGGLVSFRARANDSQLHAPQKSEISFTNGAADHRAHPRLSENLFEGLSFRIALSSDHKFDFTREEPTLNKVTKPTTDVDDMNSILPTSDGTDAESALISIPLSLPLVLKLRSTKPGGRNDILLTTLSIEASNELLNLSTSQSDSLRCFVFIESIDAVFRSGTITNLGSMDFPRRCAIDDVLNITYKLVNNDYLDSQMKNATGNAQGTSRLLQLNLKLKIQKYDEISDDYVDISNDISTLWSPVLEFGYLAPPISNSLKTVANTSHFQTQLQFNSFSSVVKNNGAVPRKTVMVNNVVGVNRSRQSLLPPRVSSPALGRQAPSAGSSPLLPSGRSVGFQAKKPYKSMLALPKMTSGVTVNLSANTNTSLSGLLLTFKGSLSIELGSIVTWTLQAINQSGRPLNLCVTVENVRKKSSMYLQGNASSGVTSSNHSSSNMLVGGADESETGLQVYSKLQLFVQYNLLKVDKKGVLVLTNNVRLGSLEPNQVFETELQLIGIAKGIFNLEGLRVIDLVSGDGIDFGKLVEVFVM